MAWARSPGGYHGPSVFDMPAVFRPKPPKRRTRRTPGDPNCADCRSSRREFCDAHKTFHYAYAPAAGLG